ncbi:MAG: terminase small subunit [Lachnospirales bacterium]|jgi:phage terminase small subunit|nr:MAG TPA: Terminase small subunit [Caudoviricetes sp.]
MTDKQRKFCDEYLIDCNATRAYRKAYPNVKKDSSAAVCAAKLLRIAKVQEYINKQLEKISSEKIADAKEVMEYLTSVLRGESQSEIVVIEGTGDGCSDARRMNKAPDEKEKLKAAELLGKRYGLFTDKLEVDGNAKVVITDDIPKDDANG